MPFKSKAQERFAYANPEKFGGEEGLAEWQSETPSSLPEKKKKSNKFNYAPKVKSGFTREQRLA